MGREKPDRARTGNPVCRDALTPKCGRYDSRGAARAASVRSVAEAIQSRVLRQAARVVGGYGELQSRLEASREDMASWVRGAQEPPVGVFVRLVEILLDAGELGRAPRV